MNIKYSLLLILLILLIIADYKANPRKKTPLKEILINLSKSKQFAMNKSKDNYLKLEKDLKEIGLNITPEYFRVITLLFSLISTVVVIIISYINKFNLIVNYENLVEASKILGKPELININFNLNLNIILTTLLITILLPRQILKLCVKFRFMLEENEILMLQTYTLMLIKSGKPVKEILFSLKDRSKMFKKIFEKTLNSFSTDPNGTLIKARLSTSNMGFEKIIRALEQCLNNDRDLSFKFLTEYRKSTKELKAIKNSKKNATKNIVSTILLIVPLLAFVFIFGYPIFTYSLKMLGSMPF